MRIVRSAMLRAGALATAIIHAALAIVAPPPFGMFLWFAPALWMVTAVPMVDHTSRGLELSGPDPCLWCPDGRLLVAVRPCDRRRAPRVHASIGLASPMAALMECRRGRIAKDYRSSDTSRSAPSAARAFISSRRTRIQCRPSPHPEWFGCPFVVRCMSDAFPGGQQRSPRLHMLGELCAARAGASTANRSQAPIETCRPPVPRIAESGAPTRASPRLASVEARNRHSL